MVDDVMFLEIPLLCEVSVSRTTVVWSDTSVHTCVVKHVPGLIELFAAVLKIANIIYSVTMELCVIGFYFTVTEGFKQLLVHLFFG